VFAVAKRKKLTPPERLAKVRGKRHFKGWDTFVDDKLIAKSEKNIDKLIDDLILLGDEPEEKKARRAVARCVKRFNKMDDDGWINTIEREDIYDVLDGVVSKCGFEPDDDWYEDADW
jgi:hypothetical protein